MAKTIINFLCNWPDDRTKAWSGTMYYLFESMKKDSRVEINDVNIKPINKFEDLIMKIRWKLPRIHNFMYKIFIMPRIRKALKGDIIFSMYAYDYGKKYHQYIYSDLNFNFLYELCKNRPYGYEYSTFDFKISKWKYLSKWQNKKYKSFDNIFCMSKNLEEFIKGNMDLSIGKKAIHVGSGVNSVCNYQMDGQKEKSYAFIGKEFERKSGDLVCEAFKQIKDKLPSDSKLYIIGPKKIDTKYISNGIVFMGEQPYKVCAEIMKKCKVFVMPSRFEAYGLVFPEALINGCICIGNNAYEMKHFIDKSNGFLVDVKEDNMETIQELAFTMLKAINSNLEIDGKKYNDLYSWDKVAKRMIDMMLK